MGSCSPTNTSDRCLSQRTWHVPKFRLFGTKGRERFCEGEACQAPRFLQRGSLDRCHILLIPAVEAWLGEQERPSQMIHNHQVKFYPNFCLCRALGMFCSPKEMPLLMLSLKAPCCQKPSLARNQVLGQMEFIIL